MCRYFMAMIILLFSILGQRATADTDPYEFVKDFELLRASVSGTTLTVEVKHKKMIYGDARFDLLTNGSCLESYPARCEGLIVRLDIPSPSETENTMVTNTFQIDLREKYGYENGVIVYLTGPNNKSLTVRW